jgi:hypothetical protein
MIAEYMPILNEKTRIEQKFRINELGFAMGREGAAGRDAVT